MAPTGAAPANMLPPQWGLLDATPSEVVGVGSYWDWNAGLHWEFAEQAESEDEGVHQERCNAGVFSGAGLRATGGKTQYPRTLRIPARRYSSHKQALSL